MNGDQMNDYRIVLAGLEAVDTSTPIAVAVVVARTVAVMVKSMARIIEGHEKANAERAAALEADRTAEYLVARARPIQTTRRRRRAGK